MRDRAEMYAAGDFIVMVVGGPNERNDYHVNETEVSRRRCMVSWCTIGLIPESGMVLPTQRRDAASRRGRGEVQGYPH